MTSELDIDRAFRKEFPDIATNLIFQNESGDYEVFGRYIIKKEKNNYRVLCSATDIGSFGSTKSALSWCIAAKFSQYNLARDILKLDNKLSSLVNDITMRAALADRSNNVPFFETVETKLESKIIHKKQVEQQLLKCVNQAKYYQQKGFNNENVRIGRDLAIKTSRSGI
jgi:hypothetical protein